MIEAARRHGYEGRIVRRRTTTPRAGEGAVEGGEREARAGRVAQHPGREQGDGPPRDDRTHRDRGDVSLGGLAENSGLVVALVVVVTGGALAAVLVGDQTGPILAFTGVLVIAVAAQYRQNVSLKAERERLNARLDHERQLQDVEHLRQFLDEVAAAFEAAHDTLVELSAELVEVGRRLDTYRQAVNTAVGVNVMLRRMAVRFPREHPVYVGYLTVRDTINERMDHLDPIVRRLGQDEAARATDQEAGRAAELAIANRDQFGDFADAARAEVGPRPSERSDDHGGQAAS
jgi:hypothetical protein